jgi:hypothetical protein
MRNPFSCEGYVAFERRSVATTGGTERRNDIIFDGRERSVGWIFPKMKIVCVTFLTFQIFFISSVS